VKQDTLGDIGIEEKTAFTPLCDTGLTGKNDFPFSGGWLVNGHPVLNKSNLPVVNAVTVNKVSDSEIQKQQLINNLHRR